MSFDLADLRLFVAVVDAGSITGGADAAGLSLPAASERIRDMEAAAGVRLLERGRRGVMPTEAGESLAHHARLILQQMARMRGELGSHAADPRATVRLLANTAATREFLPRRLAAWMAAHPRIDIELKERQSAEIVRALAAGLAEIGILSDAADTAGLTLRPFATDRLVAVVARGHPLAAARRIAFADLLAHPLVGLAGGALGAHLDAQAARLGMRLKPRVRISGFEGVCRVAAAGVGAGIVPEVAARRAGRAMGLAILRLTDAWAVRRLVVAVQADLPLAPPARDLLEHLAAASGRGRPVVRTPAG
jgi:DNA-binding transcriptional LysR family regulator